MRRGRRRVPSLTLKHLTRKTRLRNLMSDVMHVCNLGVCSRLCDTLYVTPFCVSPIRVYVCVCVCAMFDCVSVCVVVCRCVYVCVYVRVRTFACLHCCRQVLLNTTQHSIHVRVEHFLRNTQVLFTSGEYKLFYSSLQLVLDCCCAHVTIHAQDAHPSSHQLNIFDSFLTRVSGWVSMTPV